MHIAPRDLWDEDEVTIMTLAAIFERQARSLRASSKG